MLRKLVVMKGPGQAHKPVMDLAVLLSKSPDFFTFSVSDIVFEREFWPSSGREKDFPTGAPTTAVSSLEDLHGDECSTSAGNTVAAVVSEKYKWMRAILSLPLLHSLDTKQSRKLRHP